MERNRSAPLRGSARLPKGAAVMRGEVTDALSRAFFDEWAREGYVGISLERVARTAGSGKAALYRRWPDKLTMASDLLSRVGLFITEIEQQSSLEEDLRELLHAIRRVLRHPKVRRIVTDLHAEIERNSHLERAIRPFQRARRERIDELLDRAIARGEIDPGLDREIAADLIGATIYWRIAVVRGRSDRHYVARLARMIAAALRAN